jgi:membrane protein implicated in regulation of membrane protease activity
MAQIIFLAVLIGGGWMLYKKFINDAKKLSARNKKREKERQTGAIATLEKDPATGEYRVRREDDAQ